MRINHMGAILASAALAFGAAACGNDDEESANGGAAAPEEQQEQQQAQPEPVAQVDNLQGQSTAVALDEGFVEALGTLGLTPAPVGDANIENGSARFPITGGNVTYFEPGTVNPYVQGQVDHDGSGLSLTSEDGKVVELTDFVVDPGASVLTGTVTVDGEEAAASAPLFFLDGRTLEPLRTTEDGRAVLEGTTVKLKAEAADLLNQTFGTDALQEGLVIGIAKITIET
jgi:hypothetical protein